MPQKVYLVDGSGYIFRAYYAVAPLSTADGFPTNALFGYTRMLLKLMQSADSPHVAVVFDAGKETFRNKLYPAYKANREECPDDLRKQMPGFREISSTLGLKVLELPGYEADDLIGTLAKKFENSGFEVVIVSGDKDLMQLVDGKTTIWDTMRDRRFGPKEVKEKMGVPPEQIVELLGLTGDSSDNVPGLKGVGPKTAVQLIEKYGNVATILEQVEAIKSDSSLRNRAKIAAEIESNADLVRLSRKLVEVDTKVPLQILIGKGPREGKLMQVESLSADELYGSIERAEPDPTALEALFNRYEFSSLLKEFNLKFSAKESSHKNFKIIWAKDFNAWLTQLSAQSNFAFDLETNSLDVLQAQIVGASFCWNDEEAFYVPLHHKQAALEQVNFDHFLKSLKPIFENTAIKKVGQNLKFDIGVLASHGIEVKALGFDSMLASYLLNPDKGAHDLSTLAHDYLGHVMKEYEEVTLGLNDFSEVSVEEAAKYAADDANVAWCLRSKLMPLIEEQNLGKVLDQIEMPLVPVLSQMERRGVKLDTEFLAQMSKELELKLAKLKTELYELAGQEFNLNSPKQLSEILFGKLGISTKGLKKTKSGVSTDQSVLEKIAAQHPLPALILEYRGIFKLKSTYVDALPAQVSQKTGRLHARFNQAVTGTGRLSSSDPNLQNIPIQTEEGRKVRRAFIAEKGKVLISADYSQIELRVLAHMSADANLIRAFKDGTDIHTNTAREILGLSSNDQVTKDDRRIGKTINFGVIYGMGGFRLARELGIPVGVANKYIEDYFARYPGVQELFSKIEKEAETNGFVSTLFGRKRFVSSIDSSGRDQGFVLRAALNAPLQGTAADIVKLAMIKLDGRIRAEKLPLQMLMQIHDELVFECDEGFKEEGCKIVRSEMEGVVDLDVPLKVDCGYGLNWQEAQG